MDIKIDSLEVQRWMGSLVENQIPYFMLRSINDIAFATREAGIKRMSQVWDKPTTWALKTLWVDKAKDKANISARVWLNDYGGQERVLTHHFTGGKREPRASESRWRRMGMMEKDQIWVPGPAAPLDQYGNVRSSFVVQIMSFFNSFADAGYDANMTTESRKKFLSSFETGGETVSFFMIRGNNRSSNLKPGIYKRTSYQGWSTIEPVFLFVKEGMYRQAIDLEDMARKELDSNGQRILDDYLRKALDEKLTAP